MPEENGVGAAHGVGVAAKAVAVPAFPVVVVAVAALPLVELVIFPTAFT